ncbi:MAG: chemotaxis protein CheW [Melioribacteraceae bacterium]|jgi:purine-binding chemotaxis protein CheW|nr:chemotaxis protein CheW [Melioribacteraceae bacterium]
MADLAHEEKQSASEILQLVGFKIGQEEFGINILAVHEIIKVIDITTVPNASEYIAGVINLRGRIIPIVHLRKRLHMPVIETDKNTRIIVVEINGKTIGFVVDEVLEVLRISTDITEKPPELVASVDSEYITAVAKLEDRLLILLDLEKTLANDDLDELEKVSTK